MELVGFIRGRNFSTVEEKQVCGEGIGLSSDASRAGSFISEPFQSVSKRFCRALMQPFSQNLFPLEVDRHKSVSTSWKEPRTGCKAPQIARPHHEVLRSQMSAMEKEMSDFSRYIERLMIYPYKCFGRSCRNVQFCIRVSLLRKLAHRNEGYNLGIIYVSPHLEPSRNFHGIGTAWLRSRSWYVVSALAFLGVD